jgi:virulence-associated protein VapD
MSPEPTTITGSDAPTALSPDENASFADLTPADFTDASLVESLPFPPATLKRTMYAIAFDLDTAALEDAYDGNSWENAYGKIRRLLKEEGFSWQQGSVYFGDEDMNPVLATLAVQKLTKTYPWFSAAVRDIRLLRIEENNDLQPAIDAATS